MAVRRAKSFQISYKEPSIWKSYKLRCALKPGKIIQDRLKFLKSQGKGKVDLGVVSCISVSETQGVGATCLTFKTEIAARPSS